MSTCILAHRGASAYAPENTMPAFEMAADMGADGVELDIHLTKDGRLAVIHDDTVDRTSGVSGKVSDFTYSELLDMDFSNHIPGFHGVKIPLLADVYGLAREKGLAVNVEIKDFTMINGEFAIIRPMLQIEKEYGMRGNVAYSSFNHYIIAALGKIDTGIPTGILYECGLFGAWKYAAGIGAKAIHPNQLCLQDRELVPRCHENGIAVRPWTVNSETAMQDFFAQEVDAIITNTPDIAAGIRKKYTAETMNKQ